MVRQSREAAQVAAMAAYLHTWPPEQLDKLLEALDVPREAREAAERKRDPRRCLECGHGYVRCRQLDEKVPEAERHEWRPDRSRSDA